jgi:hypothetical protein
LHSVGAGEWSDSPQQLALNDRELSRDAVHIATPAGIPFGQSASTKRSATRRFVQDSRSAAIGALPFETSPQTVEAPAPVPISVRTAPSARCLVRPAPPVRALRRPGMICRRSALPAS